MKSFSPQKSKIPEIVWKESILKLEIVPKVLGSYLFKYICPPWVSWPKVLCKPHYCNSHLESEVSKLGQPHQGVVQDSFEISFFKFRFSHKRFQMGQKLYFHELCKPQIKVKIFQNLIFTKELSAIVLFLLKFEFRMFSAFI